MKNFEEIKQIILDRSRVAQACAGEYGRAYKSENETELLQVIVDNIYFAISNKVVDAQFIDENFSSEARLATGIYTSGTHKVREGRALAYGSASVEAYGSASVKAYDSASVEAYGSASVKAYDSASVKAIGSASVKAYDSASVEAYDSASVKAYDSASVKAYDSASVEAYGSASVEAYGSASVKAYDSASVKASGHSYVENCTNNGILPFADHAIVQDYYKSKVYVKKGKFEIIEIE